MHQLRIDCDSLVSKALFALVFLSISFVFLVYLINYRDVTGFGQFRRMFNIAREDSVPSWFSVILAFLIACVAGFTAWVRAVRKEGRLSVFGWILIALFFLFISADDAAEIHERLGSVYKVFAKDLRRSGYEGFFTHILDAFPSYPWQLIVGPFFALFGVFMFWFLFRDLRSDRAKFLLLAGLSFFAIAIALDFIEGMSGGHDFIQAYLKVSDYTVRHFAKSLEECIEMIGTSCILLSFLHDFGSRRVEAQISFY